jgi:hypothetical protein
VHFWVSSSCCSWIKFYNIPTIAQHKIKKDYGGEAWNFLITKWLITQSFTMCVTCTCTLKKYIITCKSKMHFEFPWTKLRTWSVIIDNVPFMKPCARPQKPMKIGETGLHVFKRNWYHAQIVV